MKKLLITMWRCLFPPALYLIITLIVEECFIFSYALSHGFLLSGSQGLIEEAMGQVLYMTACAAFISIPFMAYLIYRDRNHYGNWGYDLTKKLRISTVLSCFVGAAGCSIVINVLVSLTGIQTVDETFSKVNEAIYNTPLFLQIIAAGIVIPIVEELIFRGLVYKRLKCAYGYIAGIIGSAVLFGIYHGNITQGIYAGILGALLAYAYYKTDSLIIPIAMHMGANLTSVLLTGVLSDVKLAPGGPIIAGIIALIMLIICFIISAIFIVYIVGYKKTYIES